MNKKDIAELDTTIAGYNAQLEEVNRVLARAEKTKQILDGAITALTKFRNNVVKKED